VNEKENGKKGGLYARLGDGIAPPFELGKFWELHTSRYVFLCICECFGGAVYKMGIFFKQDGQ